jgi:hypothetical protein
MRLRTDGYFLTVGSEKRQVRQERFLQLAYHAQKHLVLARYERDEKGIEAGANDLATFAETFLKAKVTRLHSVPQNRTSLSRFQAVWSNRLNSELPFDEYFLNFRSADFPRPSWHPSALEAVFKTPATFAFDSVYNCRRQFDRAFFRSAQITIGRIAHRWLQSAFGKNAELTSFRQSHDRSTAQAIILFKSQLEIAFRRTRSEIQGPDLWWETILNKTFSLALRMLERAGAYFDPEGYYQSEAELQGVWNSAAGALALNGRTDLMLSDLAGLGDASVRILDFKTSKQVRTFDLENGDGLQFLGYQLLAKINGARSVEPIVVAPDQSKQIALPSDTDVVSLIDLLARLQISQSFGRRPSVKWEATEKLPIATFPIASAILEKKLALTWKTAGAC